MPTPSPPRPPPPHVRSARAAPSRFELRGSEQLELRDPLSWEKVCRAGERSCPRPQSLKFESTFCRRSPGIELAVQGGCLGPHAPLMP